jgi:hypothetical protein
MVFIDGISQFPDAPTLVKPASYQEQPKVPDFTKEANATLEYDGLPPLAPARARTGAVLFTNVRDAVVPADIPGSNSFAAAQKPGVVLVQDGRVACMGAQVDCAASALAAEAEAVDLRGGSITPGFTTFGSPLGVAEIDQEPSTNDGVCLFSSCKACQALISLTVCD